MSGASVEARLSFRGEAEESDVKQRLFALLD